MHTLTLDLGERSYPIHIGADALNDARLFAPYLGDGRRCLIVTNEVVAPLYLAQLQATLSGYAPDVLILPDGEQYKTLATLERIYTALLEARHDRGVVLLALGGGVIGDMTGFAAATYQRGVDFIQIPTTLLAQVDSSVGGKTGVNHPLGKNMIGAFYQPRCVVIDTQTLQTLPDRELSAGLAEVIKYGLIADADFFVWLEQHLPQLRAKDTPALIHAIRRSCETKAAVVAEDEREGGRRAILNLGHTFGHAIETGLGYGEWLHGEAVGAGMVMAAQLSERLGWLDQATVTRIQTLIAAADLPTRPPQALSATRLRELMAVDKKVLRGQLRLVLLKAIGEAIVTAAVAPAELEAVLAGS